MSGFVAPVPLDLPPYLQPVTDPATGVRIIRITKPGPMGNGVTCRSEYCSHRYSSAQAWNADQTLLVLSNGCNGLCFLDGQTYEALFFRQHSGECEWSPTDPDLMICVSGQTIATWSPRSNKEIVKFSSRDYSDLEFGPNKGNPSRDGSRLAVRATRKDGAKVVFAVDIEAKKKFPDIDLAQLAGEPNSCTISPLGGYILCSHNLVDDTEQRTIFTVEGAVFQTWAEHHRPGHGDLTVDRDGNEVYVGVSKSNPDKFQVIARRLSDGKVTPLAAYGESSHVSTRAIKQPDWAYVSYGGDPEEVSSHPGWAPYALEVVAFRIDGGAIRRIVQTRNPKFDYWSETHASPSPDGTQVIWSSNWGVPGGPVYDFVARLDWGKP